MQRKILRPTLKPRRRLTLGKREPHAPVGVTTSNGSCWCSTAGSTLRMRLAVAVWVEEVAWHQHQARASSQRLAIRLAGHGVVAKTQESEGACAWLRPLEKIRIGCNREPRAAQAFADDSSRASEELCARAQCDQSKHLGR